MTLNGPNSKTEQIGSPTLCSWIATGQFFQCNLKTPSKLKTGMSNTYWLTALQKVGGQFVAPAPYANAPAADMNPELIFFK